MVSDVSNLVEHIDNLLQRKFVVADLARTANAIPHPARSPAAISAWTSSRSTCTAPWPASALAPGWEESTKRLVGILIAGFRISPAG